MAAALANQTVIVELLLSKGAEVMARNSGGFTPLHAAAYAGSVTIAKLLLEKGAVLDDADNKAGVTPLMVAGEENHLELAEFLIAKGADPSHPEIHGYLPITRAIWKGNKDIVQLYKPRRHVPTGQNSRQRRMVSNVMRSANSWRTDNARNTTRAFQANDKTLGPDSFSRHRSLH